MYILSLTTVVEKLFRSILFIIDNAIYHAIPELYNTILAIARTSPLSQANIADMAGRIYKLLAVFMIFKVTFSLIMYIVNPDDFSDKSKGISKLITNIVISLALLVLTPYFFSYAYQLQKIVLEDNSLATVVFGEDYNNTKTVFNEAGDQIAYTVASTFISPNLSAFDCSTLYTVSNGKTILNANCFGFTDVTEYANDGVCQTKTSNSGDFATTKTLCGSVRDGSISNALTKDDLQNYAAGVQFGSVDLLFRQKLVTSFVSTEDNDQTSNSNNNDNDNQTTNAEESEIFAFDYRIVISTAAGVVILLFLITICMDVGLRSIKLAFLQLIAPIPILSYIDPKSGKDGMFKKWYQMCLKTFLSLFIRLLALYFAIYIISRIHNLVDIIDGSYVTSKVVTTFIVIGALMFAKDFVKILEGLGIKLDGGFILNPIKKFQEQALGGKAITGALGGAVGGLVGGGPNKGKGMISGRIASFGTGALRGAFGNKGFSGGLSAQADANRKMRDARIHGASLWKSQIATAASTFGLDDASLEARATRLFKERQEYDERGRRFNQWKRDVIDNQVNAKEVEKKNIQDAIAPTAARAKRMKENAEAAGSLLEFSKSEVGAGKAGNVSTKSKTLNNMYEFLKEHQGQKLATDYWYYVKDGSKVKKQKLAAGTEVTANIAAQAEAAAGLYANKAGMLEHLQVRTMGMKGKKAKTFIDADTGVEEFARDTAGNILFEDMNAAEIAQYNSDHYDFAVKYGSYKSKIEENEKIDRNDKNISAEIKALQKAELDAAAIKKQSDDFENESGRIETELSGPNARIAKIDEEISNIRDTAEYVDEKGKKHKASDYEREYKYEGEILKDSEDALERAKTGSKYNYDYAAARRFKGGS